MTRSIKETFWNADSASNFTVIHDILYEYNDTDNITEEQCCTMFFVLPDDILYDSQKYGISDTEVRDNIYTYIGENLDLLNKLLLLEMTLNY